MAIVAFSGIEMGSLGEFTSTVGTVSASTNQKNTGAYSLRINPTASNGYVALSETSPTRFSFYLYIATAPNTDIPITYGTSNWSLKLTTDRYVDLYEGATKRVDGTTQLATSTWYRISATVNTDDGHAYYWIDGNAEGDYDGTDTDFYIFMIGTYTSHTSDLYFDDIVIDTATSSTSDLGNIVVALAANPNANGQNNDFDTLVDSGNPHYQAYDDPAGGLDNNNYVMHAAKSQAIDVAGLDSLSDLGISGKTIEAVNICYHWKLSKDGDTLPSVSVYDGAYYHTTVPRDSDNVWYWDMKLYTSKPSGGAWTETAFDALEAGMRASGDAADLYLSCVLVMVAYEAEVSGDAIFASPCLAIDQALVTPGLLRDHIFSSPLLAVDESVVNPSLRADRIFSSPYFDISEALSTPTLLRESKPISPLLTIDEALNTPTLVRDSIFTSPYFDIAEALLVPEVGIAIYLTSPLLSIDEALITPTLFVNSFLASPLLQIDEALITPSLLRDTIFSSPKYNIDMAYLVPDVGIAIYLDSPLLQIDLATIVPGLLLDKIFSSPTLSIDTAYIVPVIYTEGLTVVVVPLLAIDLATITPTLLRDSFFTSPKLSIDQALNVPIIGLGSEILSPLLSIDEALITPSLKLDKIFSSPLFDISEALNAPGLLRDRIFSSPAFNIDEALLVPFIYTPTGDILVEVPILELNLISNIPLIYISGLSRFFFSVGSKSRMFLKIGSKSRMFVKVSSKSRDFISLKGGGHG